MTHRYRLGHRYTGWCYQWLHGGYLAQDGFISQHHELNRSVSQLGSQAQRSERIVWTTIAPRDGVHAQTNPLTTRPAVPLSNQRSALLPATFLTKTCIFRSLIRVSPFKKIRTTDADNTHFRKGSRRPGRLLLRWNMATKIIPRPRYETLADHRRR